MSIRRPPFAATSASSAPATGQRLRSGESARCAAGVNEVEPPLFCLRGLERPKKAQVVCGSVCGSLTVTSSCSPRRA
jgi:hypothetical protein